MKVDVSKRTSVITGVRICTKVKHFSSKRSCWCVCPSSSSSSSCNTLTVYMLISIIFRKYKIILNIFTTPISGKSSQLHDSVPHHQCRSCPCTTALDLTPTSLTWRPEPSWPVLFPLQTNVTLSVLVSSALCRLSCAGLNLVSSSTAVIHDEVPLSHREM